MRKFTLGERLRYAFDNAMSRGPAVLVGWLAVFSAVIILGVAVFVWALGLAPDRSFFQIAWMGLMRTLDAGTMGGDEGPWPFLFAMLAVTLGGVFVISTLIGILTTGLEAKLESLRKGRSKVIESGHTVILNWSEQVFTILRELVEANANQRRACVVVLADKDKVEMEDAIRDRVGPTRTTRVVCRRGNPLDVHDLEIASVHTSKSIIVLSPPESSDPDADVVKTVLAITNHPRWRKEPYHIVAEIYHRENVPPARLAGGEEVEVVLVDDLVARVVAQTCRQSGLSVVYTELLDFGGDEIYFHEAESELVGRTFGDALLAYEDSAVIGVAPAGGAPALNPAMTTAIGRGDKLIVIAADDDVTRLSGRTDFGIDEEAIVEPGSRRVQPERTLLLGWNRRAPAVINELDNYVAPGSTLMVVAEVEEAAAGVARAAEETKNLKVDYLAAATTDREVLDKLEVGRYDHVILLSYSDTLDAQAADAKTIITLLHLRDIAERVGKRFSIVSEMLDIRNRDLAAVTRADDFIVSDKLASLMLAQVSENKHLNAVFADIFDPEGSEIYLKPAAEFVKLGVPVNFYTVIESARRQGAVAIGYKRAALTGDATKFDGVVVNPKKSVPVTFAEGDKIIVVAEE